MRRSKRSDRWTHRGFVPARPPGERPAGRWRDRYAIVRCVFAAARRTSEGSYAIRLDDSPSISRSTVRTKRRWPDGAVGPLRLTDIQDQETWGLGKDVHHHGEPG
ncbi:hypothetical protein Ani05nite_04470 [Amorphoplanes nipponensis]|uniref:Uncharacterized protein n=1 Tax=Actinoplanes nipponensis TaxID=135950 RepID=A0A919JBS1_9ACTN|nr:hypothetical protein Ani05nite_04470 [Actinoplanes nipponensis]